VVKVYIVTFRSHDARRPSKFIVFADGMKSAINMAWEHGGADFQLRFDKSTAQAQEMKEGGAKGFVMTYLEALAILEAAVLDCKHRNVNTPEVREALNLLERYVRPAWLMLQFRHHALKERPAKYVERKGQQQVLLATFPGIRDSVKELIGKRMVTLALEFHDTHNMNVKNEIEHLAKEYGKLKEPWGVRVTLKPRGSN
jgi:hypothetical protein